MEWKGFLSEIPTDEQPNVHDQLFWFHEGLDKWIQKLTSVDFKTGMPYTNLTDLVTAANHIGTTTESVKPDRAVRCLQSKKRTSSENNSATKPFKKANMGNMAKTDKRSDKESSWLKEHGLCFHCCDKLDKSGKPFPHRVADCPFKASGVACKPMPQDFA